MSGMRSGFKGLVGGGGAKGRQKQQTLSNVLFYAALLAVLGWIIYKKFM